MGIIHTDLKPENVLISRTEPIDTDKLARSKNRELKKQNERQLKRFEATQNKKNKKKLNQKMNELKKNISNLDKEWLTLKQRRHSQQQRNGHADSSKTNTAETTDDSEQVQPQFEYIHGRNLLDGSMLPAASRKRIAPMAKLCDLGSKGA